MVWLLQIQNCLLLFALKSSQYLVCKVCIKLQHFVEGRKLISAKTVVLGTKHLMLF